MLLFSSLSVVLPSCSALFLVYTYIVTDLPSLLLLSASSPHRTNPTPLNPLHLPEFRIVCFAATHVEISQDPHFFFTFLSFSSVLSGLFSRPSVCRCHPCLGFRKSKRLWKKCVSFCQRPFLYPLQRLCIVHSKPLSKVPWPGFYIHLASEPFCSLRNKARNSLLCQAVLPVASAAKILLFSSVLLRLVFRTKTSETAVLSMTLSSSHLQGELSLPLSLCPRPLSLHFRPLALFVRHCTAPLSSLVHA